MWCVGSDAAVMEERSEQVKGSMFCLSDVNVTCLLVYLVNSGCVCDGDGGHGTCHGSQLVDSDEQLSL